MTPVTTAKKRAGAATMDSDDDELEILPANSQADRKLAKLAIDSAGGMAAKNNLAKVLSREHAQRIQADEKKRVQEKEEQAARSRDAKRRCLRISAGAEVDESEWVGRGSEDEEDDGSLEMGWLATQVAVKSAKTASVGAKRNSELSTKFAHILAKASTVEGKQLLQGGSRNKALAVEEIEAIKERKMDKLHEHCQLAIKAETMCEEPCKVFTCSTCGAKDWKPPRCSRKQPEGQDHAFTTAPGVKYWFECRCCQTRDSSVHKLSPHFNCIKCGVNNWKRSTKSKSKELLPGADFKVLITASTEEGSRFHDFTYTPGFS